MAFVSLEQCPIWKTPLNGTPFQSSALSVLFNSPRAGGAFSYFADLQKALRKKGVVIPTTYNDPGMNGNFVSGEGKVDIYGIDSYTGVGFLSVASVTQTDTTDLGR